MGTPLQFKNIQLGRKLPTVQLAEWDLSDMTKWRYVTALPPSEAEAQKIQRYITSEFAPIHHAEDEGSSTEFA